MINALGVLGSSSTIVMVLIGIALNILLVIIIAKICQFRWAKKGDDGTVGPFGKRGGYGSEGIQGNQGKVGTIPGLPAQRGPDGDTAEFWNANICKPFSKQPDHPCNDSVLRGWSQIDWWEGQENCPQVVGCIPSRIGNKGTSSVAAFFGPSNPPLPSTITILIVQKISQDHVMLEMMLLQLRHG